MVRRIDGSGIRIEVGAAEPSAKNKARTAIERARNFGRNIVAILAVMAMVAAGRRSLWMG
jgi:hypothetical protein